jgi:hypothetical protein
MPNQRNFHERRSFKTLGRQHLVSGGDERPLERFPTVRYRKGSAETRLKIRFNLLRQKCLSRTDLCAFRADRSGSFLNCWRRALFQCASIVMNIMLDISDARLIVR